MSFRTYEVSDHCVTYYVERNGPIAGNSAIKKLMVPINQSLRFYTLNTAKIDWGWEVKGKGKYQTIKFGAEIIPTPKSEEDFYWFTDERLDDVIRKTHRKIERELPKWANVKGTSGKVERTGTRTFLSQSRKYEITVKWEIFGEY